MRLKNSMRAKTSAGTSPIDSDVEPINPTAETTSKPAWDERADNPASDRQKGLDASQNESLQHKLKQMAEMREARKSTQDNNDLQEDNPTI